MSPLYITEIKKRKENQQKPIGLFSSEVSCVSHVVALLKCLVLPKVSTCVPAPRDIYLAAVVRDGETQ